MNISGLPTSASGLDFDLPNAEAELLAMILNDDPSKQVFTSDYKKLLWIFEQKNRGRK